MQTLIDTEHKRTQEGMTMTPIWWANCTKTAKKFFISKKSSPFYVLLHYLLQLLHIQSITYYIIGKMLCYLLKSVITLLASYYIIGSITFKMTKIITHLAITLLAIITLLVATLLILDTFI